MHLDAYARRLALAASRYLDNPACEIGLIEPVAVAGFGLGSFCR